jgi:hypothetical protein
MAAGGGVSVENARPGRMWLLGQTALGYRSIAVCWCLCVCARFIDAESTPPRRSHTKDNATVWSHANSIRSRGSDNFLRVCFLI